MAQACWRACRSVAVGLLGEERFNRMMKALRLRELKGRYMRFEKTLPDGNVLVYRPQDQCVIDEIYSREIYTRGGGIKPGDVVVDLGGHIGSFTLQASKLVGDSGRVIVCEPGPDNLAVLRENLARNGCRNVALLACAVADKPGTMDLYVPATDDPAQNPIANSLYKSEGRKAVSVPVRTLDEIVASERLTRIDLLKIDIEGAEGLVLAAAGKALAITRRLVMEVHLPHNTPEAMRGKLEAAGFRCEVKTDGSSPIIDAVRI